jgi:acetate kinase
MAALKGGNPIDTSMALTPAAGLVMGTRPGDLDPGLLTYLQRTQNQDPEDLDRWLNAECGLKGVSGLSSDMRDLLASKDPNAKQAVDLFCYQARKFVGAYAAALGGLDTLVFSAGIGERSSEVRAQICAGLEFLGINLDTVANVQNAAVISANESKITVRVIPTDEESVLAKIAAKFMAG